MADNEEKKPQPSRYADPRSAQYLWHKTQKKRKKRNQEPE